MTHARRGPIVRRAALAALVAASLFPGVGAACGEPVRDDPPPAARTPADPAPGDPPVPAMSTAATAATGGFVESAEACGIAFTMNFLPGEQGENFKINLYDHGCATAAADMDGDGDDDLLFLNQLGPNALYRNDGVAASPGGTGLPRFTDVTAESGVALTERMCVGACFADVDDDGDQDLFITTTRGGNVLFRNDSTPGGAVRFTDVTEAAGLTLVAHSETPCFFDHDGDGDLDLFLTNTAKWTTDTLNEAGKYYEGAADLAALAASAPETNRMYRNDGGLRFTDVTDVAGLAGPGWGGDVSVFDADDDGDLDLFVGNMFGGSRLYRNEGAGRFADVTKDALGKPSWGTVGVRAFDFDVDGRLDLFMTDMHSDMWMLATVKRGDIDPGVRYAGPEGPMVSRGLMTLEDRDGIHAALRVRKDEVVFGNSLFRNLGGGRFEDCSARARVETFWPWGAAVGDFDLDGDEDVFIPAGMGHPFFHWPPSLLMNEGGAHFADRAKNHGLDPAPGGPNLPAKIGGKAAAKSSRSAVVADFDGDGRPDLAVNNFNDRAHLFLNRFAPRPWIGARLTATRTAKDAVGARAVIRTGGRTLVRQVQTAGGYLAQSSRTLHWGLGDGKGPVEIEIRWPSGTVQRVGSLDAGRTHEIVEK
jgi:hypothetical protein